MKKTPGRMPKTVPVETKHDLKRIVAEAMTEVVAEDENGQTLPALELTPFIDDNKALEIRGNYDDLKAALTARRDELIKKKFSAKDMDTVVKYKREAQGYRTTIAGLEKDVKTRYFNAPKDIFVARIAALQSIVAEIESKADKVLDAEEDKRVAALTQVFDIYKGDFQAQYGLSPAGLTRIEYRPGYFNKTAKEAVSKADLEQQFKDIKAKETARASGEKMVRSLCAPNPLIDVERFVGLLDTEELGNIVEMISDEHERLTEAAATPAEGVEEAEEVPEYTAPAGGGAAVPSSSASAKEKLTIGVRGAMGTLLAAGAPDFPGKTKTMTINVIYPVEFGESLNEVFGELVKHGIKITVHTCKVGF
jgi:hypothetical protein